MVAVELRVRALVGEREIDRLEGVRRRLAQVHPEWIEGDPPERREPGLRPGVLGGVVAKLRDDALGDPRGDSPGAAERHEEVGVVRAVAAPLREGAPGAQLPGLEAAVLHVLREPREDAPDDAHRVVARDGRRCGHDVGIVGFDVVLGTQRVARDVVVRDGPPAGRSRQVGARELHERAHGERRLGRRLLEHVLGILVPSLAVDTGRLRVEVQAAHDLPPRHRLGEQDDEAHLAGALLRRDPVAPDQLHAGRGLPTGRRRREGP
ncbi:MAG: hypothetical protein AMXMBFR64_03690 [Myxococcales bacterium]